jgi:hypothetical protein
MKYIAADQKKWGTGWGYRLVTEHLPSMLEAMGSISITKKKRKKVERKKINTEYT